VIIGAAIVLRYDGRLLFEVQRPEKWIRSSRGTWSIGMGCIGGGLEGQESIHDALQREALEEIGCRVEWEKASSPFEVDPCGNVRTLDSGSLPEGVQFLWEGRHPSFAEGGRVAVFLGRPVAQPEPLDLPAIVGMDFDTLIACRGGDMTIQDVLDRGGSLQERDAIPRDGQLYPVGTPEVLVKLRRTQPELLNQLIRLE
jgi:8-oxo-dGTP pyrophosphatase MutT (NUDIX family)